MAEKDKRFLIGVNGGSLSWNGKQPSFRTRRRIAKAVSLGQSLSRAGIPFRYAVVPSTAKVSAVLVLKQAILARHQDDDLEVVTPPADFYIKKPFDRRNFIEKVARARGEDYFLF